MATTIGGVVAVLAPTVGPVVGGWITQTWSWPWLFLINLVPGTIAALVTPLLLPEGAACTSPHSPGWTKRSLVLLAAALASLMIGLEGSAAARLGLGALPEPADRKACCRDGAVWSGAALRAAHPIARLTLFGRRSFAIGCALSFCLGIGLYGSTYLMPVFLGFVRRHDAFEIGTIMLVTGSRSLLPRRLRPSSKADVGALLLTGCGLCAVRARSGMERLQPRTADFRRDVLAAGRARRRRSCSACCRRRASRWAHCRRRRCADASGLFNLMRNLGGAIGIALIDTILYGRSPVYGEDFRARLLAGM